MALVVKDRVRETTTTTGTGTVTLAGPVTGFQSFSVIGNANTTYYAIVDSATGSWEVGIGTYTLSGTTLSRDTVLESSNSGTLVSFIAGTKDVFCTYPAERSVYSDGTNITPATTATLLAASGGTGQSSYVVGDILYANTTTTLAKLADVATGNALISGGVGVAPSYGKIDLTTHISGTLPVANGGTNLSSFTANGVVYASSTSALTTGSAFTFDGNGAVISVNSTSDALRITQTGTGNALVVEDSANPDVTPFVVDANGSVIVGNSTVIGLNYTSVPRFQVAGTSQATTALTSVYAGASGNLSGSMLFGRATGTLASPTVVISGDDLGRIQFEGYDGTAFIPSAQILAEVDGTPGTGDMPGRLVFSTTVDGASLPTERMRINNIGHVKITNPTGANGLEIDGSAYTASPRLFFTNDTSSSAMYLNASEELLFTYSATPGSSSGTVGLKMTSSGGFEISRTAVTSPAATDGNVFSGTYTPQQLTIGGVAQNTNVNAVTYNSAQYMRVGSIVTVSVRVDIDATATGNTIVQFSLPIASNFSTSAQGSGTGAQTSSTVANNSLARLSAQSTDDCILLQTNSTVTTSASYFCTFTYRII